MSSNASLACGKKRTALFVSVTRGPCPSATVNIGELALSRPHPNTSEMPSAFVPCGGTSSGIPANDPPGDGSAVLAEQLLGEREIELLVAAKGGSPTLPAKKRMKFSSKHYR
jgi:hypothetical protein